MMPKNMPQECMFTNANFLVVDKHVVDEIGQLSIGYKHRDADWDYGIRALKAGFPVLTTYGVCGVSVNDHDSYKQEAEKGSQDESQGPQTISEQAPARIS